MFTYVNSRFYRKHTFCSESVMQFAETEGSILKAVYLNISSQIRFIDRLECKDIIVVAAYRHLGVQWQFNIVGCGQKDRHGLMSCYHSSYVYPLKL